MSHPDVWDRARRGQHTALVGALLPAPPQDLRVVRASCDVPPSTLGPLLEARDRIEAILGRRAPLSELARSGVSTLRRHLLGDVESAAGERSIVDVYNRLADLGPAALVLDVADAADPATREMIGHLVDRSSGLRLPLVLVMRGADAGPTSLVDVVRASCGDGAIVTPEVDAAVRDAERQPRPFDPRALPAAVVRVLRALSVAGSGCEARTLATALDLSELDVLDALQLAVDGGVPLDDRGDGRIHLAAASLAAIRATIMPSLEAALHRRLAAVLAEAPAPPPPLELDAAPPPRPGDAFEVLEANVAPSPPAPDMPPSSDDACVEPPAGELKAGPLAAEPTREPPPPLRDDARAARHHEAAGDPDLALDRYLEAMRKAAAAAAYPISVAHADAALALLDRLPPSDARRQQRVTVLLERARVLWHGAGPGPAFTLSAARDVAEAARALLRPGDPAALIADVACAVAGISYEIGDPTSLARAERELSDASRALAAAHQPREATRLFNDQASVLIRLGDPVRAAHLLMESRKVFEPRAGTDPVAMAEMAETDHLFARVLLAVPARKGREQDALALAQDHAIAAERAFLRLGAPREAARVKETMGCVELARGRLDRAVAHLRAALDVQESLGDVVGLARSTAALSRVLARGERPHEALQLLADSIALNAQKGSPIGVAFNRQALERLAEQDAGLDRRALLAVEQKLLDAEAKVGRLPSA